SAAVGRLEYDPQRGSFHGWLFTVVRRKVANWLRNRRNRIDSVANTANPDLLDSYPAPQEEADWEAEWEGRRVRRAGRQGRPEVNDLTWRAFWRTSIDNRPGEEVAADLGLSIAAVYQARSRVLARLKAVAQSAQET